MSRLTESQALKVIREAVGGSGELTVTRHAAERLRERGFDNTDLAHAIRHGRITRVEPDMYGEDRFTLEGPAVGAEGPGRSMGIVFKVENIDPPGVVVITVVDESTRFGRGSRH